MKLLFLCNQGKNRSKMAKELWLERNPTDSAVSKGLYVCDSTELKGLFEWADKIIVMEESHIGEIAKIDSSLYTFVKIVNLDIVDRYDYGGEELREILLDRFGLL